MRTKAHGFTIIEILITLVIVGVLVGIGIPSFRELIISNRVVAATNDFITVLKLTRSSSVKLSSRAIMCWSNDPLAVAPVCNAYSEANNTGYLIYALPAGETAERNYVSATDTLVRQGLFDTANIQLRATAGSSGIGLGAAVASSGTNYISFSPVGMIRWSGVRDYRICHLDGANVYGENGYGRVISISITGRTSINRTQSDFDC